MVRRARVVIPGVAHHVTQRGNNRQDVFFTDEDRIAYLDLLKKQSELYGMSVHGYCLMTNHIHLIVVPKNQDALAKAVGRTHYRFTQFINMLHDRSGHLWQNRFYSCPLDDRHYIEAMRYVERNPVHAKLVRCAWRWPWSSAALHSGMGQAGRELLDMQAWRAQRISEQDWKNELAQPCDEATHTAIRNATETGRPLGSDEFISELESQVGRRLSPLPRGRPKNTPARRQQLEREDS